MKITKITVQTHTGSTDNVYVYTDLPSPFPPSLSTAPLVLKFEVEAGKGLAYVRANFRVEPEELNLAAKLTVATRTLR